MSETAPLRTPPERVWVIVRNTYTNMHNARTGDSKRYKVLVTDMEGGFFLLEADALARMDALNGPTKAVYIKEMKEQEVKYLSTEQEQASFKAEFAAWSKRNASTLKQGQIPMERAPQPPSSLLPERPESYEEWLKKDGWSWYEVAEVQPGVLE